VITINREGCSHRLELDDPSYFEESEEFTKIEEGVYTPEEYEGSVLLLHDEDSQAVDIVGEQRAVRDVKFGYRTQFGADLGWNNGVEQQYSSDTSSFENERTLEALQEFGVEVQGFGGKEEEIPAASD